MKKIFLNFFVILVFPLLLFAVDLSEIHDFPFVLENMRDYKEYDAYSGKTNLKVDVDLEVYREGKYRLNGFLSGATVKDESGEEISVYNGKDVYLMLGKQKITFSFDGQRIFTGEFNSYKFYLNTEGYEKTVDISTLYDYKEFRQAKLQIQDKNKDYSEIASELIFRSGLSESGRLPYAEKVNLEEIFGQGIAVSACFLYKVDTTEGLIPTYTCVAVSPDKSYAFIIQDTESFNDFIVSLEFSPKDDKDYILITQFFLEIMPYRNVTPEVMWQMPTPDKTWGSGSTFKDWFDSHPDYLFHTPHVKRSVETIDIEYYTWERNAGILRRQYFRLHTNGTVIEHKAEKLGERIGDYIII